MSVSFLKKGELTALAAALALVGMAGEANAQGERGRWNGGARAAESGDGAAEMRQQRQEARAAQQEQRQAQRADVQAQRAQAQAQRAPMQFPGGGVQRAQAQAQRAEAQAQMQAQRAQAQAQRAQAQAQRSAQAQAGTGWQGRGRADDAPRWGSQRPADGQRYGRDRASGAVTRPAPAWRGATPATPQVQVPAQPAQRSSGTWQDRNRASARNDGSRDGNWDRDRRAGSTGQVTQTNRDAARVDRNRTTTRTQGTWNDNDRDGRRWSNNDRDRRDWRDGNYRRWDRNDWRRDRRYDWNRYRAQNRTVFRIGVYYAPYRNWSYRRFGIGSILNSLFFSDRYWIEDPWRYRLPEVYGPYRWIRYYDDVLLVDIYSGEVVDVIHNFFW